MSEEVVVVDATNKILGRLSSLVAKMLLRGKKVVIINAEKAVISGKRLSIIREMKEFLEIKSVGHPKYTPRHYRRPDRILRHVVRGMLPIRKKTGKLAFKRLRVYIGVPKEFDNCNPIDLKEADASKLKCKYTTLGDVAKEIGWKGE